MEWFLVSLMFLTVSVMMYLRWRFLKGQPVRRDLWWRAALFLAYFAAFSGLVAILGGQG